MFSACTKEGWLALVHFGKTFWLVQKNSIWLKPFMHFRTFLFNTIRVYLQGLPATFPMVAMGCTQTMWPLAGTGPLSSSWGKSWFLAVVSPWH